MTETDLWLRHGSGSFVRLGGIVNRITSEIVPIDIEMHVDDLDWLIALWDDYFARDWEIHRAKHLGPSNLGQILAIDDLPERMMNP